MLILYLSLGVFCAIRVPGALAVGIHNHKNSPSYKGDDNDCDYDQDCDAYFSYDPNHCYSKYLLHASIFYEVMFIVECDSNQQPIQPTNQPTNQPKKAWIVPVYEGKAEARNTPFFNSICDKKKPKFK